MDDAITRHETPRCMARLPPAWPERRFLPRALRTAHLPAVDNLSFFHQSWKWAGLQSVVRIIRTTCRGPQRETLFVETHCLSSRPADAPRLAASIRSHREVEPERSGDSRRQSFHHVLDHTFGEDHCQVRDANAAHNLCILREMTAQTLRNHLRSKPSAPKESAPPLIQPSVQSCSLLLPIILVRKPETAVKARFLHLAIPGARPTLAPENFFSA